MGEGHPVWKTPLLRRPPCLEGLPVKCLEGPPTWNAPVLGRAPCLEGPPVWKATLLGMHQHIFRGASFWCLVPRTHFGARDSFFGPRCPDLGLGLKYGFIFFPGTKIGILFWAWAQNRGPMLP